MSARRTRPPVSIPVCRPRLPRAASLRPYLERVDAAQVYSNWGPLVTELSARLAMLFQTAPGTVVCANSGTSALMAGVLAVAGLARRDRPLAVLPDDTFTATGAALRLTGYRPLLVTSSRESWGFGPDELLSRPRLLKQVGVVLPVAPYGRSLDQAGWLHFTRATGIPVVIDAAASFEVLARPPTSLLGPIPVALSFHATKAFGVGEGGAVVTTDRWLADRVFQTLNYGFNGSRSSDITGFNGKMSEYSAAVGLAELDGWAGKLRRMARVTRTYREAFARHGVRLKLWCAPEISSIYMLLECESPRHASSAAANLARRGVDTRLWYGKGLSAQPAYRDAERVVLHPGRKALRGGALLGLPSAPDLEVEAIDHIARAVVQSV